jgi:16S rRNA (uracil1498-N3)-methyltransferase
MEKHYFYLPHLDAEHQQIEIRGEEFYHLSKVLRIVKGRKIYLLDGRGKTLEAEILSKGRNSARVKVLSSSFLPQPKVKIILIQSLIKRERMELVLEKAVELGVSEIVPVITQNCLFREKNFKEARYQRWQKILIQAMKQSSYPWLPRLLKPMRLKEALSFYQGEEFCKFILDREGESFKKLSGVGSRILLLVGPEGDFTSEEITLAVSLGFKRLSLGNLRLRSETAAIVGISLFKYLSEISN